MTRVVGLLVALTGCAQVLGLEGTSFDQRDADVDAPSICDGAPACNATTGRSVCGVLVQTGATGGLPLRVSSPTGQSCMMLGSTDGPCALAIVGQPMASYFANNAADQIAGELDDCGRFVVRDLPASADDVAVAVTGTAIEQSAVVLVDRPTGVGTDTNVRLPVVTAATSAAWGSQINSANPPDVTASYLVTYVSTTNAPIATNELRVNGGAVGDPPTLPWGVYFTGGLPYGTVDPALDKTQDNGTALVVPPAGSFQLGGFRTGKNCTPVTLQAVPNALVHIALRC